MSNSVGKGFGGAIGVILALVFISMIIPCATCGGCALIGFGGAASSGESAGSDSSEDLEDSPPAEGSSKEKTSLTEDLESLEKGFLVEEETCTESKDAIFVCLEVLNSLTIKVDRVLEHGDDDQKKKALKAAKKLRRLQVRLLPKLRDAYGPIAREILWESDIHVKTTGKGYTTITYVGGTFAANRNKKRAYRASRPAFMQMRFKRVNYKWIKSSSEYTYYTVESPEDKDLVVWDSDKTDFKVLDI